MSKKKASITALALTAGALLYLYKPSDNELVVESPTQFVAPDSPAEQSFIRAHVQPAKPIVGQAKAPEVVKQVAKPVTNPVVKPVAKVKKPETIEVVSTFYVATCKGCTGITASGYKVHSTIYYKGMRIIAASSDIPFYTMYNVTLEDGKKFKAIVLDRGGNIGKGRIDVLTSTSKEAYKLGRQKAELEEVGIYRR